MPNKVVIFLRIARRFRSITLSTRTMADHTPAIRLRDLDWKLYKRQMSDEGAPDFCAGAGGGGRGGK